jgi:hypothetical protein
MRDPGFYEQTKYCKEQSSRRRKKAGRRRCRRRPRHYECHVAPFDRCHARKNQQECEGDRPDAR